MTNKDTRPKDNLTDALLDATNKDDLDAACATLQDALGVTDGGLAAICFSDLSDDPQDDQESWRNLSMVERRSRLISYIKSEVDLMKDPKEGAALTLSGFSPWHTGGGCMALAKHLPDNSYWLVTADDGVSIPSEGDRLLVGHYASDGQTILFEANYLWPNFDAEAFLARVSTSEQTQASADPDKVIDANKPRAFKDFQSTRRQMNSHEFGRLVGDSNWEDEPAKTFLVYDNQWWIEVCADGRLALVLENLSWVTGAEHELEDLERKLYEFSLTE